MPGLRKDAEAFVLKWVGEIDPSGHNVGLYKKKFAYMSDEDFDQFIDAIEAGKLDLCIVAPNLSDVHLDVGRNLEIGQKLGHKFFERVWMPAEDGHPAWLTPKEYLLLVLPKRRQAQHLEKKISVPQDNNSVDDMTGQVTGASKGSKISYPELQVMMAMGLEQSATELMKVRGGDEGAFNASNTMIQRTGEVSMKAISPYATGVKANQALEVLLTGMMLKAT